jgi:hypothetical protein
MLNQSRKLEKLLDTIKSQTKTSNKVSILLKEASDFGVETLTFVNEMEEYAQSF